MPSYFDILPEISNKIVLVALTDNFLCTCFSYICMLINHKSLYISHIKFLKFTSMK